jgi:hypothetical protein
MLVNLYQIVRLHDSEYGMHVCVYIPSLKAVLGPFAKLRKATIIFVLSVRQSVRMEHLDSHWTDFREICYLFLENLCKKSKFD